MTVALVSSDHSPVVSVRIDALRPADSPRLAGEDENHVHSLAEAADVLPPILVHRPTMRVIDGMHRVRAAMIKGSDTIDVRFFDGDEHAAFLAGVQANVVHGLPLSLADRKAAAARVLATHGHLSDRLIAKSTGLSSKTVGAIRRQSAAGQPVVASVGLDGRVRPAAANVAEGRRLASELIAGNPMASLREIAKAAGISPGTVRDVRDRLRRGEDPVPPSRRKTERTDRSRATMVRKPPSPPGCVDPLLVLGRLKKDPALRFTDSGRFLLRWLDVHVVTPEKSADMVAVVPPHCSTVVASIARLCALAWQNFAEQVERCESPVAHDAV